MYTNYSILSDIVNDFHSLRIKNGLAAQSESNQSLFSNALMSTRFLQGLQEAQGCAIEVGGGRLLIWVAAQKDSVGTTGETCTHRTSVVACLSAPRRHKMSGFLDRLCLNRDFAYVGAELKRFVNRKLMGNYTLIIV